MRQESSKNTIPNGVKSASAQDELMNRRENMNQEMFEVIPTHEEELLKVKQILLADQRQKMGQTGLNYNW